MSNSQKKQQSKAGIKTDKYGAPLNFGNYKNGRLMVKKPNTNGRGKNHRNGTANQDPSTQQKQQHLSNQKQSQKQTSRIKKNEAFVVEKKEKLASVGLTGAAHDVIKDALLVSSTLVASSRSTDDNLLKGDGGDYQDANAVANGSVVAPQTANTRNNKKQGGKSGRHSFPDLVPPPIINDGTNGNDPMGPMGEQRRGLPVYNFKDSLLDTIAKNRVTVVEGETGSGKTTQVPQFCLEDAAARGVPCNIIIAQPRRISAMSVAERVAAERGEAIGKTVGYTIRLESKATTNTRLLFCTTGILLKRLEEDAVLQNVTHVFVDEVHERSIESDFLLMVLKDMLPKRPSNAPLKVILMSATLDASLFHDYFWDAPSVKFPGRTFPVTELYLEDALEVTNHVVRGNEDWCNNKNKKQPNKIMPDPMDVPLEDRDDMLLTQQELALRYSKYSPNTQAALAKLDHNAIDYALVVDTIQWLCSLSSPLDAANYLNNGSKNKQTQNNHTPQAKEAKIDTSSSAILVFLPGIKEITTLQELLVKSLNSPAAREWVLPIHSSIPPEEQRLVFTRPPKGVRKVVLATNIAETAITIDDVAFVVDTGRMKENRYDPLKRMSSLEDCLVARSNARQRRGRAGRVREGVAVHLFSRHRHDKITLAAQAPEVQRVPLEQLVLRIKALQYPGTAAEVCARLVEPPAPEAVQRAVEELVFLEALKINNNKEELTALGVHLSTLPVDCRIGKLILLGAMFGVCDDALTIAATLSYRNPFMAPIAKREEADRAKMSFATAQSDHLTVLNAYKQVDSMGKARYDFCKDNFLSIKTLQTIAGLKRQFLELLSAAGFVRPNLRSRAVEALGRRNGGCDGVALALQQGLGGGGSGKNNELGDWECLKCKGNNFARNTRACYKCRAPKPQVDKQPLVEPLVEAVPEERVLMNGEKDDEAENTRPLLKALLVAALFPQMVVVEDSTSAGGTKGGGGGGMVLKAKSEDGQKEEDLALHPSCITGKAKGALSSKYLVYHERVKTTRVYIRDATPVSPYALILFGGGRMEVEDCPRGGNESVLRLDGWLGFKCPRRDHLLVMELREVLDGILRHKVENPKQDFTEEAEGIIDAVKAILTMDEEGKAMAPERLAKGIENAFESQKKRNNNGGAGRAKTGGSRGGGKSGRGGARR
jgi:HrpA-like RNA helicase